MAFFPGDQKSTPMSGCFRTLPCLLGEVFFKSPDAININICDYININICDYWAPHNIGADIATKDTLALYNVLQSFGSNIGNSWVDTFVDSRILLRSWNRRGSRSHSLVTALKSLFETTMSLNIDLHVILFLVLITLQMLPLVVSIFRS